MKKLILLLMALMPLISFSQISFSFENGQAEGWFFSPDGRWSVDEYGALSGAQSLHHSFNNTVASADVAAFSIKGLCLTCAPVTWSFMIRHGYPPSSSNKWAFILCADVPPQDLTSATGFNGYIAGVNITGYDDTLRLYRVNGTSLSRVISTSVNWDKDVGVSEAATLSFTSDNSGGWTMALKTSGGTVTGDWRGNDISATIPLSAGIVYSYTSSADQLLWLDNVMVSGVFIADTSAPVIVSVEPVEYTLLRVVLDEEPYGGYPDSDDVTLAGGQKAINTEKVSQNVFNVFLDRPLSNKTMNTLRITDLCDQASNCASEVLFDFLPAFAEAGDVIIDEIMFDPTPSRGLPEKEYIEVINRGSYSFSTRGWILVAGDDTAFFPATTIGPASLTIICGVSDTSVFKDYGDVTGLSRFPGLNDTGEKIALRDGYGKLIHALTFGPELFNDAARSGGGWSAEMTDVSNPFNTPGAWHASVDVSGGTPGRENSFISHSPDITCPRLLTIYPVSTDSYVMQFTETMRGAAKPESYSADDLDVVAVRPLDIADMNFLLTFDHGPEEGMVYQLSFSESVTDYAGNSTCESQVFFGSPETASAGDLLFNEILFNPVSPCTDFIELYNNSMKVLDLSDYYFTMTDPGTGIESTASSVCSFHRLIMPGEILALTEQPEAAAGWYSCARAENIIDTRSLPPMPVDKGLITLYDKSFRVIDRVRYGSSMHMPFISDAQGVSLEKADPSLSSEATANWHSASEGCNWGSPGAANSSVIPPDREDGVSLSAERISPDGDGCEDLLSVDVFPGGDGNVVSIDIFNDRGMRVRRLTERFFAGAGQRFVWDGTGDDSRQLPMGLYLVVVTVYDTHGTVRHWKKVCAVLYE